MKEHSIIYSTEMVRATLEGWKTKTRRTWGLEEVNKKPNDWDFLMEEEGHFWFRDTMRVLPDIALKCPYGQVGDRLWVRETVWESDCGKYICYPEEVSGDVISETIRYTRNEHSPFQVYGFSVLGHSSPSKKGYAFKRWFGEVDLNKDPWVDKDFVLNTTEAQFHKKKASIHMPRWASRITLEITGLKVERLQEISEADCIAEGFPEEVRWKTKQAPWRIVWFKDLWDSLNAKRGYGWETNPWVWVIQNAK